MSTTTSAPAGPAAPAWTTPVFWVTQLGAVLSVLLVIAGVLGLSASFTGQFAADVVPVAAVIAFGFEAVWVVHHHGLSKTSLGDIGAWLLNNFQDLKLVLSLVKHVPVLAKLASEIAKQEAPVEAVVANIVKIADPALNLEQVAAKLNAYNKTPSAINNAPPVPTKTRAGTPFDQDAPESLLSASQSAAEPERAISVPSVFVEPQSAPKPTWVDPTKRLVTEAASETFKGETVGQIEADQAADPQGGTPYPVDPQGGTATPVPEA